MFRWQDLKLFTLNDNGDIAGLIVQFLSTYFVNHQITNEDPATFSARSSFVKIYRHSTHQPM